MRREEKKNSNRSGEKERKTTIFIKYKYNNVNFCVVVSMFVSFQFLVVNNNNINDDFICVHFELLHNLIKLRKTKLHTLSRTVFFFYNAFYNNVQNYFFKKREKKSFF